MKVLETEKRKRLLQIIDVFPFSICFLFSSIYQNKASQYEIQIMQKDSPHKLLLLGSTGLKCWNISVFVLINYSHM